MLASQQIVICDADSLADRDSVTSPAHALNVYMARHPEARLAYEATWGYRWEPLPTIGGEAYFPTDDEDDQTEARLSGNATATR